MKIHVELDFKDIYFANCVKLYGNHRLMTGNILAAFSFVKTGIVQELCNQNLHLLCTPLILAPTQELGVFFWPFQRYYNEGFDTQNLEMSFQRTGGPKGEKHKFIHDIKEGIYAFSIKPSMEFTPEIRRREELLYSENLATY